MLAIDPRAQLRLVTGARPSARLTLGDTHGILHTGGLSNEVASKARSFSRHRTPLLGLRGSLLVPRPPKAGGVLEGSMAQETVNLIGTPSLSDPTLWPVVVYPFGDFDGIRSRLSWSEPADRQPGVGGFLGQGIPWLGVVGDD